MGQRSQYQVRSKQAVKRKKARRKLVAKGLDPKDYYYGGYYIKLGAAS